jgi:brassinosteroid resistant 1/2
MDLALWLHATGRFHLPPLHISSSAPITLSLFLPTPALRLPTKVRYPFFVVSAPTSHTREHLDTIPECNKTDICSTVNFGPWISI